MPSRPYTPRAERRRQRRLRLPKVDNYATRRLLIFTQRQRYQISYRIAHELQQFYSKGNEAKPKDQRPTFHGLSRSAREANDGLTRALKNNKLFNQWRRDRDRILNETGQAKQLERDLPNSSKKTIACNDTYDPASLSHEFETFNISASSPISEAPQVSSIEHLLRHTSKCQKSPQISLGTRQTPIIILDDDDDDEIFIPNTTNISYGYGGGERGYPIYTPPAGHREDEESMHSTIGRLGDLALR